jgi:hypothetical protein
MAAFEDAVLTHGAELRTVRDEVGTRTIYDVVRYYGHWKKYIPIAAFFPACLTLCTKKQQETRGREPQAAYIWHLENTTSVYKHCTIRRRLGFRGFNRAHAEQSARIVWCMSNA